MSEPATCSSPTTIPGFARASSARLTREGYRVVLASDGRAALERVQAGGIDLIVTDLQDAGADRARAAPGGEGDHARRRRDPADRLRHGRGGGEGDEGRRLRLPHQAVSARAAHQARRQGPGAARPDRAEPGAQEAAGGPSRQGPDDRREPGLPADDDARRADRRQLGDDPDPGRERHGQGAGRARHPRALGPAQRPVRRRQLRGAAGDAARVRAVRLREGRVHGRRPGARKAASSWPTAARSSSTRSATSRWSRSPRSCACSRRASSSAWAERAPCRSTCASWPRPIRTWPRW